jgi:hypothetical protein
MSGRRPASAKPPSFRQRMKQAKRRFGELLKENPLAASEIQMHAHVRPRLQSQQQQQHRPGQNAAESKTSMPLELDDFDVPFGDADDATCTVNRRAVVIPDGLFFHVRAVTSLRLIRVVGDGMYHIP